MSSVNEFFNFFLQSHSFPFFSFLSFPYFFFPFSSFPLFSSSCSFPFLHLTFLRLIYSVSSFLASFFHFFLPFTCVHSFFSSFFLLSYLLSFILLSFFHPVVHIIILIISTPTIPLTLGPSFHLLSFFILFLFSTYLPLFLLTFISFLTLSFSFNPSSPSPSFLNS